MLSPQLREDLQSIFFESYKDIDPKSAYAQTLRRMRRRFKGQPVPKEKLSSERPAQPTKQVGGRVIPSGHKARIRSDGKVMVHDPKRDRYY